MVPAIAPACGAVQVERQLQGPSDPHRKGGKSEPLADLTLMGMPGAVIPTIWTLGRPPSRLLEPQPANVLGTDSLSGFLAFAGLGDGDIVYQ
jgi:hypothetical protein